MPVSKVIGCVLLSLGLAACGRVGFDFLSPEAPATGTHGGADGDGDRADVDGGGANVDAGGASGGDAGANDAGVHASGDAGHATDAGSDGGQAGDGGASSSSSVRMAALPYTADMDVWNRIIGSAPSVAIAVLNPSSGVGPSQNPTFLQYVIAAQAVGISMLGYVDTNYANRSVAEAEAEIDQYLSWYGVDGIYFDQTSSDCVDQPYYQTLFDYVRQASTVGKRLSVVLDPGNNVPECYASVADTLVIFQNSYAQYQTFKPSTWTKNYPSSLFWHLVYDSPAQSDMEAAVARARTLHAGYVWVTSDTLPNPWDTLPNDVYFLREVQLTAP
jgi:hypothetical protein